MKTNERVRNIKPEYRRQWRKLHIGIDAKTLQIGAVQLTTNDVSDSQVLDELLKQIPQDEQIDSVYTDGAYDTKKCWQVIRIGKPMLSFRREKMRILGSLQRNDLLRTVKHLGRAI